MGKSMISNGMMVLIYPSSYIKYIYLYPIDFPIIRYNPPIIVGMYLTNKMVENPKSWWKARCHDQPMGYLWFLFKQQ